MPPGYREPEMDYNKLADAFDLEMGTFFKAIETPTSERVMPLLQKSRQPALLQIITGKFFAAMNKFPKKRPPPP